MVPPLFYRGQLYTAIPKGGGGGGEGGGGENEKISDEDLAVLQNESRQAVQLYVEAQKRELTAKAAYEESMRKTAWLKLDAERALHMYDRLLTEAGARNVAG